MDTVTMSIVGAASLAPLQASFGSAGPAVTPSPARRDAEPEAPAGTTAPARVSAAERADGENRQRPVRLQPAMLPSLDDQRDAFGLTAEERRIAEQMRARHDEVVRHEEAHKMVGGQYASAPRYEYAQGPDGRRYAVSGSVQIDTAPERDPEDTIAKMETVKRAALAPAEPSAQDRRVAQMADQVRQQAQAELMTRRAEERRERMAAPAEAGNDPLEAYRQRAAAGLEDRLSTNGDVI